MSSVPSTTGAGGVVSRRGGELSSARRRLGVRRLAAEVVERFEEHDLLTSASAISFQIFTAIVPFLLFAFALLGFLSLGDVWQQHVAPHVNANVSPAAYAVINHTVDRVLASGQAFWMTAGLVLAVWQISGAVRAVMGALNRIYRIDAERPLARRMLVSIGLAVAVATLLIATIAVVSGLPLLYGDVGQPAAAGLFVVRWGAAGVLMLVAVGLLLRYGPAVCRPMRWVTLGTGLVVVSWILMSIGFGVYLRYIASYESVFGNLASIVVLMAYVYLSALVFLAGPQVDAVVRRRVEGA